MEDQVFNPFTITHSYQSEISHDFSKGSCTVPLEMSIKNIMSSNPVSFMISTGELHDHDARSFTKSVKSQNEYFWKGVTRKNIPQLDPRDIVTVTFFACFTKPGVFDLNDAKLGIKVILYENPETKEIMETYLERKAHPRAKCYALYGARSSLIVKVS
jgi:hypothetical protein